jgi:hypothetical protein
VTNPEKSIFHSTGMPLGLSESAGVGRAQSPLWMSPFSVQQGPPTVSQRGGVPSSPALDGFVDKEESASEVPDEQAQEDVPRKHSGLPADRVTQAILPSSFSWPVGPQKTGLQYSSPTKQGEQAERSNQNLGTTGPEEHQESTSRSITKGFSESRQRRFPTLKTDPATASNQGLTEFTASSITREISSTHESRTSAGADRSAAHTRGDSIAAHVEPWSDRQIQGSKSLGALRLAVVENSNPTRSSVKVTALQRTLDHDRAGPRRPTGIPWHNWATHTFSEQKLRPQTLTTSVAAKANAVEVLEKLSSGGSQAPPAAASGRRVHIGKLHITVQRPAGEVQPQQVPIADAQHASQPTGQSFFDPWERHYSSFD